MILIDKEHLIKTIENANKFNDECPKWVFNVIRNMPEIEVADKRDEKN